MGIAIELRHITRQFPGVTALDNICLSVEKGEVHALCGENGAGKSTLINIISGNLQPGAGELLIEGQPVSMDTPLHARKHGIAVVHQEKSLVDSLSIADNIFAGRQPRNSWGFIDVRNLRAGTKRLLEKLQLDFSPDTLVADLSPSHKQMVEIAKALAQHPSILLLDEPTASITGKETDLLFNIIRQLKTEGVAIIYISHRMAEIFTIADKVSVLKDGKYQGTREISGTDVDELIRMMVGRNIPQLAPPETPSDDPILEVDNISGEGFRQVSFTIKKGEIVGLAGLIGSGRTEIAKGIFGDPAPYEGQIKIKGKTTHIRSIPQAIAAGIGLVPEERKTQAIFPRMTPDQNLFSADLSKPKEAAAHYRQMLRITSHRPDQPMNTLSGGNQQKIVLARWLLLDPDILIVDEPTHGVDIGVKYEIYQLLREQAAKGKGILLISSELSELLLLSHTILVVRNGTIIQKMSRSGATEENIMHAACGF